MSKTRRAYGLWSSPLSPLSMARGGSFSNVGWSANGELVWLEGRAERGALVVQPPDGQAPRDLNSEHSARGRVGYGGGDFTVGRAQVFFVEAASGRVYRQPLASGPAQAITPAFGQAGGMALSPDERWLLFVHTAEGQDTLAIVDSAGRAWPQKLVSGEDFYMQPAWSPRGDRVAWIAWNHPNMPWDGTVLRIANIVVGAGLPTLGDVRTLAGDEGTAIYQPEFAPDGRSLVYAGNASGWWQLYQHDLENGGARQLTHAPADHGQAAWVQGLRTHAFSPDGSRLYFLRSARGISSLWQLDLAGGAEQPIPLDPAYTQLDQIAVSRQGEIALLASGGQTPQRVITVSPGSPARVVRRSSAEEVPAAVYALPEAVAWPGMDGGEVYGLFYAPRSDQYEGIGRPPLVVLVHGGPTGQARAGFNARAQFFATRGYAVLEVNHRGSTGYGRAYQDALYGNWGIYDVQDSVSGARALAEQGRVDGAKMVIMGGSAGGFTVLKALEDYPGFFKAGICLYGVANQFDLAADTHKFEAHYSDKLLGPLPEAAEIYRQRSPIFFAGQIQDALAIFQGEVDPVVPRKQSDDLAAALQRRGVPHVYHVYPGEGHGFRKAETIEHMHREIEKFLRQWVIYS